MKSLTANRLREVLRYLPELGEFRRRKTGEVAGGVWHRNRSTDYLKISVDGCQYFAHRLAWFYVNGEWPQGEVDHVNGNGLDNRISNLRDCARFQNATNSLAQKSSRSGLRGVHFHPGAKRYRAQICKNNKTRHLGYFDTPELAHEAYLKAAHELHGEFVRERPRSIAGAIAFRA
jgi:hypothetical protein